MIETVKAQNLILFLALVVVLGFFMESKAYAGIAYSFFMGKGYQGMVFLVLGLVFVFIALGRNDRIPIKAIYAIVLIPLVFLPLFRCYFHIPHIFCHVCPRRCPWGYLRPITVPAVLAMNLSNRTFCASYCPIGTLQDEEVRAYSGKTRGVPGYLSPLKYVVLLLVIASYFMILASRRDPSGGGLYDLMFKSSYSIPIWAFTFALGVFALSFSYPRLWCRNLCPVGILSKVVLNLENRILRWF